MLHVCFFLFSKLNTDITCQQHRELFFVSVFVPVCAVHAGDFGSHH